MAKKETKKKPTQVAIAPIVKGGAILGGAFGAGRAAEKLYRKYFSDDEEEKKEEKPKKDKKPIKELPDGVESLKVRKGGLIRSKPRDGIAKKGKTKGRIIRGVFNK